MFLDNIIPHKDLSEYVKKYTIVDLKFPDTTPVPFKAYPPHPFHCLQFYLGDTEVAHFPLTGAKYAGKRVVVTGQHTMLSHRHIGKNFLTIQVVFQPGALHRLSRIPLSELNNSYVDADLIFGPHINFVNERLFHAEDHFQMVAYIEEYLRRRIRQTNREIHYVDAIAKSMLLFEGINRPVTDFARQAFLSPRQFQRKFIDHAGVSPRFFMRIVRFWTAYKMRNRFPQKDWLSIALHAGYYDYQHLSKDYLEFTGMSPVDFTAVEHKAPERQFGGVEI